MDLKTIKFGRYKTDALNTRPIEWFILNQENGTALLLSKSILDLKKYHSAFENVTWDKCSIREWLNNTFYNKAFYKKEKESIQTTLIETEDNYFVKDKVFLISSDEFYKYLPHDTETKKYRAALGSEYALNKGLKQYIRNDKIKGSCWFLRNPGDGWFKCRQVNAPVLFKSKFAAFVSATGGVCPMGVAVNEPRGIRPAIRIIYSNEKERGEQDNE